MKIASRIFWITLFAAYLAFIVWLCFGNFKPSGSFPRQMLGFRIDKVIHFFMFLPFPILGTLALNYKSWWRTLACTTLMANIIAFVLENLQSIITESRVTDPADLNANLLGVSVGLLISILIGLIFRKK